MLKRLTHLKIDLLISIFWLSFLPTVFTPVQARTVHEAIYEAKYQGINIRMNRKLIDLGEGRFKLHANAKNFLGSIEEYEEFLWRENGDIIPQRYRYQQRIFGSTRNREIDFDWDASRATASVKGNTKMLPLEPGTLGPMSYQLKLQLDILRGERLLNYTFVDREKLKSYSFVTVATQPLEHKKYQIANALHLKRKDDSDRRQTNIWLDADDKYTLASLEQIKDKKTQRMFLTSSQFFPPLTDTPFELSLETAE